jgi:hypothetical protein
MTRALVVFCFAVFLYSCGGKQNQGIVLPTAKMQAVMWDMFLADAYTQRYIKTDSSKNELQQNAALQQKIFELHKISRADFYTSYEYYNNHPDMMRTMLDSITVKSDRERNGLMQQRYSGGRPSVPPHVPVNIDSIRKSRITKN